MIQQGVSAGESSDPDGGGMTIGRIMDYIEARLEAIKSREEEDDEDEEETVEKLKAFVIKSQKGEIHLRKLVDQYFLTFMDYCGILLTTNQLVVND